ncbi:unnamed protein product [Calypogeia fissa]
MATIPVDCRAWPLSSSSSSIPSLKRVNSGKDRAAFSDKRFANLVCCCKNEENSDEMSVETRKNFSNLGRREALASMLAGISIGSSSSGSELEIQKGALASEINVEAALFNNEVAANSGITSDYVRPFAASGDLPLHSLLPTSRRLASSVPSQVWVSLHGPNQMQVSWITSDAGASTVDYGMSSGSYTHTAKGSSSSYTYERYTSGNIHFVRIGPLADNTTYFYRVGGVAPEFSFKTPPPAGPNVPITFAVVGDLGQTANTQSTLDHIQQSSYDVLILPGDLSYADGDQPRWDSYGHLVSPLASSRPWMVTQGNHEIEPHRGIEDFRAYNARWQMPYALSGSDSNLYFSFEVAGVHWLMLGSYADYSQSSNQYKWLQSDLAKVDRSKTPWLIGVVHAPWYNSNLAHYGEGDGMLEAMEDLLFKAKVDIVFAGHVHAYERSVRMYKGKPNNHGILYLNIGDGGNREGLARVYYPLQPKWSAFREASYGHGKLTITNSTTAVWTWHRNQDDESVIADSVIITTLSSSGGAALKLER